MIVDTSVTTNTGVPPEVIDAESTKNHIGVVKLVVMANPRSNESPGGFYGRVSTEASSFSRLAT